MQTATLKEVTRELGVSPGDVVRYHRLGSQALIQIDLKLPQLAPADNSDPDFNNLLALLENIGRKDLTRQHDQTAKAQNTMAPEEEFRRKYPNIKIRRPELFKLVGCMADVPPDVSDKDLIIDAIESKYGK